MVQNNGVKTLATAMVISLLNAQPVHAALNNVSNINSTAATPYVVDVSYNGENDQIISSEGTVSDKSYVSVGDGVNFTDTTYEGPSPSSQTDNLHGSVVYAYNSVIRFGGNNVFSGNKFNTGRNTYGVIYAAAPYRIGEYNKPQDAYSNEIIFGNNTLFENNSAVMGNVIVAEASEGGSNTINFGENTQFKNNITSTNQIGNGGNGGVIMSTAYGEQNHVTANNFNFDGKTIFEGNRGVRGGVILTDLWAEGTSNVSNNFNFNGDVSFINNTAEGHSRFEQSDLLPPVIKDKTDTSLDEPSVTIAQRAIGYGGAIYGEVYGNDDAHADNFFNFKGTTIFSGNKSQGIGGAVVFMSDNEKPENVNDIMNFSPQNKGQYVLFENNTGSGQLNSFYIVNTKLNFNLQKGTYANIRDPIYATGLSEINKGADGTANGDGGLYLWGNNDDFRGSVNINHGSFYAMFEENQTSNQKNEDPLGQRVNFSMANANTNFAAGTLFRPMMNANRNKLAQLNIAKVSNAQNATLVPYEISKLTPRDYVFDNNY